MPCFICESLIKLRRSIATASVDNRKIKFANLINRKVRIPRRWKRIKPFNFPIQKLNSTELAFINTNYAVGNSIPVLQRLKVSDYLLQTQNWMDFEKIMWEPGRFTKPRYYVNLGKKLCNFRCYCDGSLIIFAARHFMQKKHFC